MSFPRYPSYKPSGVEWLGEVPEHWEVKKIRNFASFTGGGTPSRENLSFWGGPIPWVSPKDMKIERIIEAEEGITQEGLDGSSSSLVATGHVLIVVRSGILRHTIPVAINAVDVAINQDMKVVRMDDKVCTNIFFLRWIQGLNNQLLLAWAKQGATVESVEQEYLSKTVLPLPTLAEQAAITTFLDHETAKIDALIAEQQRLIELLQEKRQAAISHAVTKGLNPDAPMKDSGVEWLGEVPMHWGVTRLKHVTDLIVDCPHETPTYTEDGEFLVIRTADLDRGTLLNHSHMRRVDDFEYTNRIRRAPLERCDIVYGREGERWGHAALVPLSAKFCLGQRMMQFRCGPRWAPAFLMWLLNSRSVYLQGSLDTVGATSPHVNVGTIRNYALPEPPLDEQALIADSVATQAAHYDSLIHQCQQSSCLLSERRSALISAAVTGQIDVRGLVREAEAA
jgi:type I restriction enzyme S subunit